MTDFIFNEKTKKVQPARSKEAHLEDLLRGDFGHWKHAPVFGIGAKRALHSDQFKDAAQRLKIQAQAMKIEIKELKTTHNQWHIKL